ncbi:MAG: hypothetical protein AAB706_01530 [Patescibacteria group bacterium]
MTLNYKNILALAILLTVIGVFSIIWQNPWQVNASVRVGDQYQATTTPQVADGANLCPARLGMASSTTGVLGSVNFLNANTGTLTIYDATTTDNTLRVSAATSSLILAEFPTSPTEGSYHFDIEFQRGLLIDYSNTNTVGTSTISYRCGG